MTKEIWLWCLERNIYISAFHIPGVLNTRADNLSRQKLNLDMEWTLRKDVFLRIMDLYGPCDIDLFASSDNHQLPQYVSYLPDPKAVAVNAFSLSWTKLFPFIFCPFSDINSVLQKLEHDKAEAVMVALLFTTQPWFPRPLQQVSAPPVLLPKVETILLHQNNKSSHPLQKMTLGVFRVSGKNSVVQDFKMTLSTSSSIPGDLQHVNSMGRITRNGCCFVVKGKLINMTLFTPHSTRSGSTSAASNKVSVETVLKSAGWKKDCVFRKYYKRSVSNNSDFSNAVLSECTVMT